jgi:hypothetical protein
LYACPMKELFEVNMSIYFTPRIILNKISYSFSMTSRVIKSDGQSILLTVIIIILLWGVIRHQDYENSYSVDLTNQNSKKMSLFLYKKNLALQNLTYNNSEQTERTEVMISQIEMALFSQGGR